MPRCAPMDCLKAKPKLSSKTHTRVCGLQKHDQLLAGRQLPRRRRRRQTPTQDKTSVASLFPHFPRGDFRRFRAELTNKIITHTHSLSRIRTRSRSHTRMMHSNEDGGIWNSLAVSITVRTAEPPRRMLLLLQLHSQQRLTLSPSHIPLIVLNKPLAPILPEVFESIFCPKWKCFGCYNLALTVKCASLARPRSELESR